MEDCKVIERPTARQVKYAESLAKKNKVALPTSYTKKAYSEFIYKNKNVYNYSEPYEVWIAKHG